MVLHDAPSTGEVCHHEVKSSFSLKVNKHLRPCVNKPCVNRGVISRLQPRLPIDRGSVRSRTERSDGLEMSLPPKPPLSGLNYRPKMFDEADQRSQEFDQPPSQEAEPCDHYGHNQCRDERD